jgi:hypothetical protein
MVDDKGRAAPGQTGGGRLLAFLPPGFMDLASRLLGTDQFAARSWRRSRARRGVPRRVVHALADAPVADAGARALEAIRPDALDVAGEASTATTPVRHGAGCPT